MKTSFLRVSALLVAAGVASVAQAAPPSDGDIVFTDEFSDAVYHLPIGMPADLLFSVPDSRLAGITRIVPRASRRRLRRSVLLFGLYALVIFLTIGIGTLRFNEVAYGFEIAGNLLRVLLIINLSALAVFDLMLPLTGWDFPDMLHDLTVGTAYLVAAGWLMPSADAARPRLRSRPSASSSRSCRVRSRSISAASERALAMGGIYKSA